MPEQVGVRLEVQAHVVQRAALAVADRDHEALADEDHDLADLDELVAVDVAGGLEHHEQRVAAVDLELGALVGVDGVLDGQRVQLEVLAHRLDHARAGVVQPDPHEAVLAGVGLAQRGLELDAPAQALAALVEAAVDDGRARSPPGSGAPGPARAPSWRRCRRRRGAPGCAWGAETKTSPAKARSKRTPDYA